MAADDWSPAAMAAAYAEGTRKYGSTGQLWEVRNGQWVRVDDPERGRLVPKHGSGPDNQ